MTDQPITQAQLDMLERVVDKVFSNLNIDVEFTRHFLDRVNDTRNKKQITIRELGELFAKEYKRWGNTIKHMPVDSQAVMKDLSSAINIPFVLNKDGKEKDLVAKTVMRKKDFKTPNKQLPVESVIKEGSKKLSDVIPQLQKELNAAGGYDRNVFELEMGRRTRAPGPWGFGSAGGGIMIRWMTHGAKSLAEERGVPVEEVIKEARKVMKQWLQQNTKPMTVRDRDSGESKQFYIRGPLAFDDNNHFVRVNTKRMLQNPSRFEIKEEMHGAKKGTQVKGRDATPKMSKPTKGGETPHPMRGKLVGEGIGDNFIGAKTFAEIMALKTDAELAKNYQEYVVNGGKGKTLHPRKLKQVQKAIENEMARREEHDAMNEEPVNEISDKKVKSYLKKARKEMPRYVQQAQAGKRWAKENPGEAEYWDSYSRDMGKKYGKRNAMVKKVRGRVEETDKQTWDVVANGTGKILATFDIERLAPQHYWVQKGWATVKPNRGGVKGERYIEEGFGDPGTMTGLPGRAKWRSNAPKQSPEEWKAGNKKAYDDMVAYQQDLYNKHLKSGRKPNSREKQTWRQLGFMEDMDQAPLDVPTPTPLEISNKHGVSLQSIENQLAMGIKVELEHTTDREAAREIALDHLNEMPNYYSKLLDMETEYTPESIRAAWDVYKINEKIMNPHEALLRRALEYLDKKIEGDREGKMGPQGHAFDIARSFNIGMSGRELYNLWRNWSGSGQVMEGWLEENLYYLDEIANPEPKKKVVKKKNK